MLKTKLALATVPLAIGLLAAACGPGATTTTTAPPTTASPTASPTTTRTTTPAPTATGGIDARALFTANCAACHGANRQGVPGLAPALTPASLSSKSVDQVKDTLANGKAGTAMNGFAGRLTAAQIDALAQYVKTAAP